MWPKGLLYEWASIDIQEHSSAQTAMRAILDELVVSQHVSSNHCEANMNGYQTISCLSLFDSTSIYIQGKPWVLDMIYPIIPTGQL